MYPPPVPFPARGDRGRNRAVHPVESHQQAHEEKNDADNAFER